MREENLFSRGRHDTAGTVRRALAVARAQLECWLSGRIALKVIILLAGVAAAGRASFAVGNTITVNSLSDDQKIDGSCSLREAINNSNAAADTTFGDCTAGNGNDTIKFSKSLVIDLFSSLPTIQNSLTIDGTGPTISIRGTSNVGPLLGLASTSTVALINLTLQIW